MDLTSTKTIKEFFEKYEARPSKRMGQNFLVNKSVLQKIVNAADLQPNDIVLEIGPGIGTLTQELVKKSKLVIAIEKDRKMIEILRHVLNVGNIQNVEIIEGDVLKLLNSKFQAKSQKHKVVANIPYYLTSPLIRALLENKNPPKEIILLIQKEVAQRICAKPPNMSLLSVSVQFYAKPEIISYVSKNCFWPSPKVDSAIIKITPKTLEGRTLQSLFFKIVKAGFSQPRKQLGNNLSKMLKLDKQKISSWLLKNNIHPSQRAETLSIDDWIKLTKTFKLLSKNDNL